MVKTLVFFSTFASFASFSSFNLDTVSLLPPSPGNIPGLGLTIGGFMGKGAKGDGVSHSL